MEGEEAVQLAVSVPRWSLKPQPARDFLIAFSGNTSRGVLVSWGLDWRLKRNTIITTLSVKNKHSKSQAQFKEAETSKQQQ